MDKIINIRARSVLDSRGNPTVEVEVRCGGGTGRAIVPSGASTGKHEARELRDHDPWQLRGMGVRNAVANVNTRILYTLCDRSVLAQREIDQAMIDLDGTPNKANLGANAILGVSLACAHAAAAVRKIPLWLHLAQDGKPILPMPMVNLISGGLHAGRNLEFQDFLLVPLGARTYSEALLMAIEVYRSLAETLIENGFEGVLVGDEGGFGPRLSSNEQAVEMILSAFERAGLRPGSDAALALDVASTHFHHEGKYQLRERELSQQEFVELLIDWVEKYPIVSIEDGMAEDDWQGWKSLTERLGKRVQLIGDDLFVTNPQRLERGIREGVANSILIKLNQIGTLTETLDVVAQARAAGYRPVISARSGETEDTTIADLAVATGAGQIKIGSVARSERLCKYNQLLRIEEQLSPDAVFAKWKPIV